MVLVANGILLMRTKHLLPHSFLFAASSLCGLLSYSTECQDRLIDSNLDTPLARHLRKVRNMPPASATGDQFNSGSQVAALPPGNVARYGRAGFTKQQQPSNYNQEQLSPSEWSEESTPASGDFSEKPSAGPSVTYEELRRRNRQLNSDHNGSPR